jgi:hypothetical protein
MLLCAAPLLAQSDVALKTDRQPLPETTPLAVTVSVAPAAKDSALQFVTITLTNTSDHDVRFPMPNIGCGSTFMGSVKLVVNPAAEVASSCVTDEVTVAGLNKWTTLKPGETANFGELVTPLLPKGAGTVEVRGVYTPPQIKPDMQEELYRESVTYPTETLTSAPATIVRDAE